MSLPTEIVAPPRERRVDAPHLQPLAVGPKRGRRVRRVSILGVPIVDMAMDDAVEVINDFIDQPSSLPAMIFFANAHTLNLVAGNADYCDTLRSADYVFGDGTGIRWAAKMRSFCLTDNVNGTDFTPRLLDSLSDRRRSFFMLGADQATIKKAAAFAEKRHPDWELVGFHHGYVQDDVSSHRVLQQIDDANPDVLLVGMGNPIQEMWLSRHREAIRARVCMGIGGLFDFWAGNVSRAPHWIRRAGYEWLWRLGQEPVKKSKRYLIGNPLYLYRVARHAAKDRREMHAAMDGVEDHSRSVVPR